jgi:hypothetical protein
MNVWVRVVVRFQMALAGHPFTGTGAARLGRSKATDDDAALPQARKDRLL